MIKLITIDLERALLGSGKLDLNRLQEQLDQMQSKGIHLVLTSDSPYSRFLRFFAQLKGPLGFVGENGAVVVDQGVIADETFIDHQYCEDAIKWLLQQTSISGLSLTLSGRMNAYSMVNELSPFNEKIHEIYQDFYPAKNLASIIDQIYQIRVDFTNGNAAALMQEINHEFRSRVAAEIGGANSVFILDPEINRARGLSKLKKELKIKDDQVASIGADLNDLIILKHAQKAYAIENAVPEMHQIAEPLVSGSIYDTIDALIKG